jgi:creatinine amidohydrolase
MLTDMTSKEAADVIKKRKIVVLSIGAIHKHGDGPLGTDFFSCQELTKRVGEAIPEKVIVVPTLPYGVFKNVGLPGDIEISFEPVRQIIKPLLNNP